jgi:hypothetical protein
LSFSLAATSGGEIKIQIRPELVKYFAYQFLDTGRDNGIYEIAHPKGYFLL